MVLPESDGALSALLVHCRIVAGAAHDATRLAPGQQIASVDHGFMIRNATRLSRGNCSGMIVP
jgi:hypothetical protein